MKEIKQKNPVAKFMNKINKNSVHKDKKYLQKLGKEKNRKINTDVWF